MIPLSLPNWDEEVFTYNDVTGEYVSFILNNPLLQAYEQHIEQLTTEIQSRDDKYSALEVEFRRVFWDNEDLKERLVEITKELIKVSDQNETQPIEKGGTGMAVWGNKEMTDLLEVMKRDHETLVD